jgi:hypothetical protein
METIIPQKYNIEDMQKNAIFASILICFLLVLAAGCTGSANTPSTQTTTPKDVFGTWSATFGGATCTMVISPTGEIQQQIAGTKDIRNAQWTKAADGSLALSKDLVVGHQSPLVYDQGSDSIKDNTGLIWTRIGTSYVTVTTSIPAFEIISKEGTCQKYTKSLYIEGMIKSNAASSHTVTIKGAAYDDNNVKLGSSSDYVDIDAYGTSKYKIIILDGCSSGPAQFTVEIDSYR